MSPLLLILVLALQSSGFVLLFFVSSSRTRARPAVHEKSQTELRREEMLSKIAAAATDQERLTIAARQFAADPETFIATFNQGN